MSENLQQELADITEALSNRVIELQIENTALKGKEEAAKISESQDINCFGEYDEGCCAKYCGIQKYCKRNKAVRERLKISEANWDRVSNHLKYAAPRLKEAILLLKEIVNDSEHCNHAECSKCVARKVCGKIQEFLEKEEAHRGTDSDN